jgi:hypothetical protein
LKLNEENEIEFCQEYKYLGVIDTSGTDDKENTVETITK